MAAVAIFLSAGCGLQTEEPSKLSDESTKQRSAEAQIAAVYINGSEARSQADISRLLAETSCPRGTAAAIWNLQLQRIKARALGRLGFQDMAVFFFSGDETSGGVLRLHAKQSMFVNWITLGLCEQLDPEELQTSFNAISESWSGYDAAHYAVPEWATCAFSVSAYAGSSGAYESRITFGRDREDCQKACSEYYADSPEGQRCYSSNYSCYQSRQYDTCLRVTNAGRR